MRASRMVSVTSEEDNQSQSSTPGQPFCTSPARRTCTACIRSCMISLFRSFAWCRCMAPRTSSRVNPRLSLISRYVSPACDRVSKIATSCSTFLYFLAIVNASCRSLYATTGGGFSIVRFLGNGPTSGTGDLLPGGSNIVPIDVVADFQIRHGHFAGPGHFIGAKGI